MNNSIELTPIGLFDTGIFDDGGAEIPAFDAASQQLFVTNGANGTIDVLNLIDPSNPTLAFAIDIEPFGGGINSVAVNDGILAAAIESDPATDSGSVVFFDSEGNLLNEVTVGSLPDQLTFTPDGTKVLVANEGEADEDDPSINPPGSVSIIDLTHGVDSASVTTADFTAFDGQEEELRSQGVRIFPDVSVSEDVEPEFITVSGDSSTAFVALQENNTIAVVDIDQARVTELLPLGAIDFSESVALDPSDEDGGINIANQPVFGLFQPDSIDSYHVAGETFIVTANEGDSRDEVVDVIDIELDPDAFPNAEELQAPEVLGNLEVSSIDGDLDGDGDFDQLFAYGSRSFSIRDRHGNIVFDSGDDFERITAELVPEIFNSNGTVDSFDTRSNDSGPEPEGIVVGEVGEKTFAFIGLERTGGIMVYDVTVPAESQFVQYINPIDSETGDAVNLAPEGLAFIAAEDSPNGEPLLAVANEISGTTSIFAINEIVADDEEEEDTEVFAGEDLPLEESQEVEPVEDTAAEGEFDAVLDGNSLSVTGSFSDLTSALFPVGGVDPVGNPEGPIHVHVGDVGENGPIIRNFDVTDNGDGTGSFAGVFELTDQEVATATEDGLYVNLHTENNQSGELRGQIDLELSADAAGESEDSGLEGGTNEDGTFTLQLLHASDQEAGLDALVDAPNFSAVLDALRDEDLDGDGEVGFANTLTLSSGDAYIPSPFFAASDEAFGDFGRGDIIIQNELGFEAIALGNHEFDLGTGEIEDLIEADEEDDYPGTLFPYLSSNLDFTPDDNLAGFVVEDGQEAGDIPNSLAGNTIITVSGEQIGVVGATTPTLEAISSPGDVAIFPMEFDSNNPDDIAALAAEIQASVDSLLADNPELNKVVLLAHFQLISIEEQLSELLTDVDIIVAGGSNTILADDTDILRAGDEAAGAYPILNTAADGNPIAVVNTDGNYRYVGRLVVDFDENGVIIPESVDPEISGAYATDEAGVAAVGGTPNSKVVEVTDAIGSVIADQGGNTFGDTDVFLNGQRIDIRSEETNFGNLAADANLEFAQSIDPEVTISLRNGGGIRDSIGEVVTPAGSTSVEDVEFLPPQANEIAGTEDGEISQLDIANSLSFNNGISLVTVTAEELLALVENGVSESEPGAEPGRFPQIAGFSFSFDASLAPGDRVVSLATVDDEGNVTDVVVEDGEIVGDPSRTFRTVTLNFLADGGDDFPFPETERVDLIAEDAEPTGAATFAPDGSEQDVLAEFIAENFSETPFDVEDTPVEEDTRIQNLAFREDTVLSSADETVEEPDVEVDIDVDEGVNTGEEFDPSAIEFIGEVSFETGFTFGDTEVGGLSGLTFDRINDVFYIISDDRSTVNDARYYDVAIDLSDGSLDEGDIEFANVTTLFNAGGDPFASSSIDAEGIALNTDGQLFISSEGDADNLIDPLIGEFNLSGQIFNELPINDIFLPTADQSSGIQDNLALESLTITPDGASLYTATENALFQDGETATLNAGSPVRIVQYDLETETEVGQFLYETDPIPVAPDPADGFADNGLVELLALDDEGKLLALERSFAAGEGNNIRLYEIDLSDAPDISGVDSLSDTDVAAVEKDLLLDFGELGIELDNSEGISFGEILPDGRQSLIVVSDNNFNDSQETQFLAFALGEADPMLADDSAAFI
ncbi:MAG: choice-of-anchor I family protein [Cyanobacteria bacterium J06582_2]